ncbi:MAG: hypothetical protein AAF270_16295 [Pseudomonadota bacterium]
MSASFDSLVSGIAREAVPSNGDNLLGFKIDADHYSRSCSSFESASVTTSADPLSLIEIRARFVDTVQNLGQAKAAVIAVWSDLAYSYFQATETVAYRDRLVTRFLTRISDSGFFVSGRFVVSGSKYRQLALSYEKTWGESLSE